MVGSNCASLMGGWVSCADLVGWSWVGFLVSIWWWLEGSDMRFFFFSSILGHTKHLKIFSIKIILHLKTFYAIKRLDLEYV